MSTAPDYVPHWTDTRPSIGAERDRMHNLALGIECPYCQAGIGAGCVNPRTGQALSWRLPAHTDRIRASEQDYYRR